MPRKVKTNLIAPAKLAHYVLRVTSMADSIAWYQTVLGMQVVHRDEFICFLTYDEEHHRLAMVQVPSDSQIDQHTRLRLPGLDHVAYTLLSLEDLLATYKRLKAADILPVWSVNHGLTTSLYFADPDGHRVEFQVENLSTKRGLQDYMQSEAFAKNPVGIDFDPEALLRRFEAGDAIEELLRPGAA
jgi:catechol-2,3-dioxygenase